MLCYIFLNGESVNGVVIDENSKVIVADGALDFCLKNNIKIDLAVGDFDSLGYIPENSVVYPSDKCLTDGEIALIEAKKMGADKVLFLGAGGLREDHFLGNLALLEIARDLGIEACIETNYSKIFLADNYFEKEVKEGAVISVIALEKSLISSSLGLKYEYNNVLLKRNSTLGISNEAKSNKITLNIEYGKVLVIINK